MTRERITLTSVVPDSYRVSRIVGASDLGDARTIETTLEFDRPPGLDEAWSVGMIVGASGSGKSSIARTLYPNAVYAAPSWGERAIVDEFSAHTFEKTTEALAAVGLGTQTHWLRPFNALSVGERFRCELARTLLDATTELVVVDEFASALDRRTAATACAALRKAFDRGAFRKRLVALAHDDELAEYLEPDWVLRTDTGELTRGRLRRALAKLALRSAPRELWADFKKYHYLSGSLNKSARCYIGVITDGFGVNVETRDSIAAFGAIVQSEGRRGRKRAHRLVVKPEYQGVGIGGAFLDLLAEQCASEGSTLEIVTGSASFARKLERSSRWKTVAVYPHGRTQRHKGVAAPGSFGRAVVSFIYTG